MDVWEAEVQAWADAWKADIRKLRAICLEIQFSIRRFIVSDTNAD